MNYYSVEREDSYLMGHTLGMPGCKALAVVIEDFISSSGLSPIYIDMEREEEALLKRVCQQIYLSRFAVYDLANADNNTFLQMGISLGLNRPVVLVGHRGIEVLDVLGSMPLVLYDSREEFRESLAQKVSAIASNGEEERNNRYCHFCGKFCDVLARTTRPQQYLIALESRLLHRDFALAVKTSLEEAQLTPVYLSSYYSSGTDALCRLRDSVASTHFGVYDVGRLATPAQYFTLGISIGSRAPWFLLAEKQKSPLPALQEFVHFSYDTEQEIAEGLLETIRKMIPVRSVRAVRVEGTTDIRFLPFWSDLNSWIASISSPVMVNGSQIQGSLNLLHIDERRYLQGRYYIPEADSISIGRSTNCKVVMPDNRVSSTHANVYNMGGKYLVKDMGSTNGTLLNGEQLVPYEMVDLNFGDRITIAGDIFIVWDGRAIPREVAINPNDA